MRKTLFACVAVVATLSGPVLKATATCPASMTVDRAQVRSFLARLAITPESVCAAGMTAEDIEPLFQAAAEQLDTLQTSLNATDANVDAARTSLASLVSDPQNGEGQGSSTMIEQAQNVLQAAIATRVAVNNTAFSAVTAALTSQVQSSLSAIRTNQRQPVAIEFKIVLRSQSEWTELNAALSKVKINGSCALAAPVSDAGVVAAAATDPNVSLARARLDQSLATVKTAWTSSINAQ
ncbi:MAG: hypothetical protein QM783_07280 [Phycisphaerales bacterium]